MKIASYQPIIYRSINNLHNNRSVSFGTCSCQYKNPIRDTMAGAYVYTKTELFRDDLDFGELADYIIQNFKEKEKVNIYCMAGSDGSEAYSLAIALMERIPKSEYKKYFPIISIDRDETVINNAKKGRINLTLDDLEILSHEVKSGKQYFINPKAPVNLDNDTINTQKLSSYEPIPELKNAVKFKLGNLSEELSKIKDNGNSVVMCRNVLPYLHSSQVSNAIYDINEVLKKGSMFIIGEFDDNTDAKRYLYYYDFRQAMNNVFIHP